MMRLTQNTLGWLLTALALSACASPEKQQEPLAEVARPKLRVLMMGEVHDNREGHRARFDGLRRRVEAGWRPAIVMEQFDREHQALLTQAQKDCADPECVIRVTAAPSGWDWSHYWPVLNLALRYDLPLVAGNLSRADASRTVREGIISSFDSATVQVYGLAAPVPADIRAAQQKEIIASHCNMLPAAMVDGMVNAQIARDIWMAKIVRAQAPRDVVLLAGNGHVRKDIGVARWLNLPAPAWTIRSEGFLEEGTASGVRADAYDAIHTIVPKARPDPCVGLKAAS